MSKFNLSSHQKIIQSVVLEIDKIFNKSLTSTQVVEEFSKKHDSSNIYYGVRYLVGSGEEMIRFNFSKQDGYASLQSIDIWVNPNPQPHFTVDCSDKSESEIASLVVEVLKGKHIPTDELNEATDHPFTLEDLYDPLAKTSIPEIKELGIWLKSIPKEDEDRILKLILNKSFIPNLYDEYVKFAKKGKIEPMKSSRFKSSFKNILNSTGALSLIPRKNSKDIMRADQDIPTAAQDKVNASISGRPARSAKEIDEKFDDLVELTEAIADGHINSLIVTGTGGAGKSHTVEETLKEHGVDYKIKKGSSTAKGLYLAMFENNEGILVYDDCDSIFYDKTSVNLFKAALDTKESRWITWDSERMPEDTPNEFEYTGRVIFISNLSTNTINEKTQGALKSRSVVIEFDLTGEEMLERLERLKDKIMPEVASKLKTEIIEHLKLQAKSRPNTTITVRALTIGVGLQKASKNWKRLMKYVN
jgi:hypothetical protein